jgi:hypothetical protein
MYVQQGVLSNNYSLNLAFVIFVQQQIIVHYEYSIYRYISRSTFLPNPYTVSADNFKKMSAVMFARQKKQ